VSDRQPIIDALNELRHLTTCRCEAAWTDRGRHETHCAYEYRTDVDLLAFALGVGQ
jgi:hypothetical protein